MIHYDEIDVEIRRLIYLINEFPGIRTTDSCAGHPPDMRGGYVSIIAESQKDVLRLIRAMPFWGPSGRFAYDRPQIKTLWASLMVAPDDEQLVYTLSFEGDPPYVQRELIGEIENSLSSFLSPP